MGTVKVRRSGPGLQAALERIDEVRTASLTLGVQGQQASATKTSEEPGEGTPPTLYEVAVTHEFGDDERGIPQRSFLRATLDEKRAEWAKRLRIAAKTYIAERDGLVPALGKVGAKARADVQRTIQRHPLPILSEAYAERIDVPREETLIRTGQLVNSIRYVTHLGDTQVDEG